MRRRTAIMICAWALLVMTALTAGALADVEENLTYQGNKARITVGNIKPKADECTNDMAASIGEMLSTALTNTGRFIVLASKEEVNELADEIDLAQSGYVEEGRGPEKGLMEGADILVTGAVTSFEPNAGGKGGLLGGLKKKTFGAVGASSKSAEITMDIKLIDIRTRRILKAKKIEAKSTSWKAGMGGGTFVNDVVLGGGLGAYSNTPMEKAIRTALAKSVETVSKEVPQEYYRYTGQGQYTQEYGASGQQTTGTASAAPAASAASGTAPSAAPAQTSGPVAEDMKLYTKYDFIPGNKVIFYDDLSDDEEGEFPYRWNLDNGVFEIARLGGELWILCTDAGYIRPRMADASFPETYTVEMDFYNAGPEKSGPYYYIYWVDADGDNLGNFEVSGNTSTSLDIQGKNLASKNLPEEMTKGTHTMRIMATSRSLKCYIDNVRVANVPRLENFNPVNFRIRLYPYNDPNNPCMIRNFRFAEGGKSFKEQMAEAGRVVTHGILFDKGSHVIKAESYKTLKEIGDLLTDDPTLRICIEGHTDSDGADDYNMDLSTRRAESVKAYLVKNYGISADRLECKGMGETKPVDSNDTPEGKANNRRVELVKL